MIVVTWRLFRFCIFDPSSIRLKPPAVIDRLLRELVIGKWSSVFKFGELLITTWLVPSGKQPGTDCKSGSEV